MNEIELKLDIRIAEGKKVAKLRENGFVPSVVYGGQDKPYLTQSMMVPTQKAVKAAGKHSPLNLVFEGKKHLAIIKDVGVDPVKQTLRHIAFHTINKDDVITTEVPIVLIGQGESKAERAGLVIIQVMEDIEIKAKPANLPEALNISILDLATDEDKILVGDIKLPAGVEFADVEQDMELVIANVYEPGALQAANDAAGGDAEESIEATTEASTEPAKTE